jgi:putative transposase
MALRAATPGFKTRRAASPGLHRTRRGFGLEGGRPHLAGGLVRSVVWSPADPR